MTIQISLVSLILMTALIAGCATEASTFHKTLGGPGPGDVFRERTYAHRFGEVDPEGTSEGALSMRPRSRGIRRLAIKDLDKATRAEVSIQYWGGHIGTADQRFRVNESDWFQVPQPRNTPTEPQCYYRTVVGDNPVEIPLDLLKEGRNKFQFTCGKQIRYSFNWGLYWIYSFTVRVYYRSDKEHINGKIISPAGGTEIGENPVIAARIDGEADGVKQVDFLALYDDYDWEGNGVYRQWHGQFRDGKVSRHVGTASEPPYSVTWDTTWVPDQDVPVSFIARIVGKDGTIYMTRPVSNVTFKREGRSVKMYKATSVPEAFGVRSQRNNWKACKIKVPDSLENAKEARIVLSTWSADHAEEIGLNRHKLLDRIGEVHDYSFDAIPIPLNYILKNNRFYIHSTTEHHAAEVNWPGPAMLIEFEK
jgi:hypothetical protein